MSARGIVSAALAAALAGLAAVSGGALVREARATGLALPARALADTLDERAARALHDVELYRALREATPEDARVFVIGDAADAGTHHAFTETEPLVFPRRFFRIDGIPEGWTPGDLAADARVVAVGYGALRDLDLSAFFEPLAEGARFRLWRLREGGR